MRVCVCILGLSSHCTWNKWVVCGCVAVCICEWHKWKCVYIQYGYAVFSWCFGLASSLDMSHPVLPAMLQTALHAKPASDVGSGLAYLVVINGVHLFIKGLRTCDSLRRGKSE